MLRFIKSLALIGVLMLLSASSTLAQTLRVTDFNVMVNDLSARTEGRTDLNGIPCALLKVQVADKITDVLGSRVGDIVDKGMEKWIYLVENTKEIEFHFENHFPLHINFIDYNYPTVSRQMTYLVRLQDEEATPAPVAREKTPPAPAITATPAKTAAAGTLETEILYKLDKNEKLFFNEIASNLKANSSNFAAFTIDTVTKKQSLVVNGRKILTADYISSPLFDLENPSRQIYSYRNGDEWYLMNNGNLEGPFEALGWPAQNLPNTYAFKRMGSVYVKDSDGSIYPAEGDNVWNPVLAEPVMSSFDARHKLKLSNDRRNATINGTSYKFPIPASATNIRLYTGFTYVSNDGKALCNLEYSNDGSNFDEYFTLVNGKVTRIEPNAFRDELQRLIESDGLQAGLSFVNSQEQLEKTAKWTDGLNLSLSDDSGRHLFTSAWNYDYVMIDNRKIECNAPFFAFYDKDADSFVWISLEKNQLVKRTYKL